MVARTVAIRVDASLLIGTGHFTRCLALAQALKARGAEVRFVARHLLPHLRLVVLEQGFALSLLDAGDAGDAGPVQDALAHAHWLGVSQVDDADATRKALSGQHWDWLVVDHYALDAIWETLLRPYSDKVLVIDDLADRRHDCNTLLDQNFYLDAQTRYVGKLAPGCQQMLGPRYALLGESFHTARKGVQVRSGRVSRILLFFGGVDAENLTGRVMDAVATVGVAGAAVDVVIGAQHACSARIVADCAKYGYGCHVQTPHMADLMARADLAIGAGGTAVWERLCLGLPTLALGTATNQSQMLRDLAQAAYLWGVVDGLALGQTQLESLVQWALMGGPAWRGFSARGMDLVDGAGVARVVRHLMPPVFEFRPATMDDARQLFEWRNHPAIRAVSNDSGPLDASDHAAWMARTLADGSRHLLMAQLQGVPMGVVRFDVEGQDARISVYLAPAHLHEGLGPVLLRQAANWLRHAGLPVRRVVAQVRALNLASLQSFYRAGYEDETHTLVFDLEQA